jgi:large subunit ribosomal protein L17
MNQAKSLILHKRIITTVAKAKALRKFVEPIITKAKQDSTHARRVVFSYFQDKEPVKLLFNEVAPKIGDRPGGYTRIIRMGNRFGDNAEMCLIELVDYNDYLQKDGASKPTKSKTRRGKGKSKSDDIAASMTTEERVQQDASNQPAQQLSENLENNNSEGNNSESGSEESNNPENNNSESNNPESNNPESDNVESNSSEEVLADKNNRASAAGASEISAEGDTSPEDKE